MYKHSNIIMNPSMHKILVALLLFITFSRIPTVSSRGNKKDCKKLKFEQRINQDNHEVNSLVGSAFKFDCRVIGTPEPNITWTKDDLPLKDASYRFFGPGGLEKVFVLNLKNLLLADAGRYKCTADNGECKSISTSLKLIIKENSPMEIPRIKYFLPLNPTIQIGESVTFSCVIEKVGDFTPHIKWIKYRTYKEQPTVPPTTPNTNESSTSTTTALPPTTMTTDEDRTLNVERVAQAKYIIDGIVHETTEIKIERSHRSELMISSATLEDTGEYSCMTFNEIGFDKFKSYLMVKPKPPLTREELERVYIRKYGQSHKLPFSLAAVIVIPICLIIIIIIGCVWWHSNEERLEEEKLKLEKQKGIGVVTIERGRSSHDTKPIAVLHSTTSDSGSNDEKLKLIKSNTHEDINA